MYEREDLIIGEQKYGWTRHIPSTSIRIGGIPFDRSYRVWCPSKAIIELDRLMLNGRKGNAAEARDSASVHRSLLNDALRSVWIQCLEGIFDVSGKPSAAFSHDISDGSDKRLIRLLVVDSYAFAVRIG